MSEIQLTLDEQIKSRLDEVRFCPCHDCRTEIIECLREGDLVMINYIEKDRYVWSVQVDS